jgi:hypothetical protein
MHSCRSNFRSKWIAEGGYEPVAERMFNDVNIDGYFLEWETERAGGLAAKHKPRTARRADRFFIVFLRLNAP